VFEVILTVGASGVKSSRRSPPHTEPLTVGLGAKVKVGVGLGLAYAKAVKPVAEKLSWGGRAVKDTNDAFVVVKMLKGV